VGFWVQTQHDGPFAGRLTLWLVVVSQVLLVQVTMMAVLVVLVAGRRVLFQALLAVPKRVLVVARRGVVVPRRACFELWANLNTRTEHAQYA
jgi:hypothetical protein